MRFVTVHYSKPSVFPILPAANSRRIPRCIVGYGFCRKSARFLRNAFFALIVNFEVASAVVKGIDQKVNNR